MDELTAWAALPWVQTTLGLILLLAIALLVQIVLEKLLLRIAERFLQAKPDFNWLLENKLLHHLAKIAPPFVVQYGVAFVPHLPPFLYQIIVNVSLATAALFIVLAINALLDGALAVYVALERERLRSIKSYIQLSKILVFVIGAIVMIATLIDRSPIILLSSLGAMSAVLLVVFKDTIVAFASSFQLTANDIIRIGDWIDMPQLGADGRVVEIALQTVRVRNWNKTITTIPTPRLITDSFKNWRPMLAEGVWRIDRVLRVDADLIDFLDKAEVDRLSKFPGLSVYLGLEKTENDRPAPDRPTNLGAFRAYIKARLLEHPKIDSSKTCVVRLLEDVGEGIPIQLCCFVTTTDWPEFEAVQSEIFDHLFAILPEFGLGVFQKVRSNPTVIRETIRHL